MADNDSTEPEYVRLLSSDDFEFIIHREAAMRSGTIRNMLSGSVQFRESVDNVVKFEDIKGAILEVVCRYLYFKWKYEGSTTEIPEFKIETEMVLELLMAADFLEC